MTDNIEVEVGRINLVLREALEHAGVESSTVAGGADMVATIQRDADGRIQFVDITHETNTDDSDLLGLCRSIIDGSNLVGSFKVRVRRSELKLVFVSLEVVE